MIRAKGSELGFTLLETLVALAILGVIMTTVYAVIGSGLRTAHRDEDRLLLGLVAQNLLTRSQLDLDPSQGAITGDIQGGLRWRIESEPYAVPQGLLPEAPPQAEQSPLGSREPGATEDAAAARSSDTSSFGEQSATSDRMEQQPAETGQSDTGEAPQEPREPMRLRLIRVLVEKGDQQFALSTLAIEPPRERNQTR